MKNTQRGDHLSEIVKKANNRVPKTKPIFTEEVRYPIAEGGRCNICSSSSITAFPENQSEVPVNCERTITGKIQGGRCRRDVFENKAESFI
jgi:hypothetical protein